MIREGLLDESPGVVAVVGGEEGHQYPDAFPRRGFDGLRPQLPLDEAIRDAGHHPRTIARAVSGASTAMVEVVEALNAEPDDPVRRLGGPGRDEPDTARIVVIARVVERIGRYRRHSSSRSLDGCGRALGGVAATRSRNSGRYHLDR